MRVKLAQTAGFCYGVREAVEAVYKEIESADRPIYTYGPIVHNETVVRKLSQKGVRIIDSFDELKRLCLLQALKGATVIIRAHGAGKKVYSLLNAPENEIKVVDATCPFVRKIHETVIQHHLRGERIIITGSTSHPEVQGILEDIDEDALVITNPEEASDIKADNINRYCLVSQTTFNTEKFKYIVDFLRKRLYYVTVVSTICSATRERQQEAYDLSRQCDAMIVIGGRDSSNTAKLYEICKDTCRRACWISSLGELDMDFDENVHCIGITAGASTPQTVIQEVLRYVRDEF